MNKPFQKSAGPISYAEGPRLKRALELLDEVCRRRFAEGYQRHVQEPFYSTVQRCGAVIELTQVETGEVESYDFGQEGRAQQFLTAMTDCFRSEHAPIKVLMPLAAPR